MGKPSRSRAPAREVEVPSEAGGLRLDRFLSLRFAELSRSFFAQRIRKGQVQTRAGRVLAASYRVTGGETLCIFAPELAPSGPRPPFPTILWQADGIVAVDKPAGLLAHPTGTRFTWALVSMAKDRWPEDRVDLAHRLDRDTSGVLLLTRSRSANRFLKQALKEGEVDKEYLALIEGTPTWRQRMVDAPIGPADGPIRIQMAVRPDGLPARTEVEVLERHGPLTLVRCRLLTGRTHQIRVHLAHLGHRILGDRLYGVPPDVFLDIWENGISDDALRRAGAPRHALHAWRTTLPLPAGGRQRVEAPLAPDLVAILTRPDDPFAAVRSLSAPAPRAPDGPGS